jgi:subtilase family serine protease
VNENGSWGNVLITDWCDDAILRGSNSGVEIYTRPAILISHTEVHPSKTRAPMKNRRRGLCLRPQIDLLDDRCLLSGLTPAQVAAAYGLNAITFTGTTVKGDGSGVTIALIEMYHDPNLASDLATFDQKYGLPTPTLTVVNLAGTQTNSSWGEEESLDVEWAHAIAPGANILVVEAAPGNTESQQLQNLMAAVQTASTTPGVAVVSMSWGFPEFSGETAYDKYFTTPGITYVAASGDSPGVEYPAASPDVVAVGGTTLALSSSGGYGSETAWDDSGGGYSQYEAEPAYQESVQTTGQRSTPDVAFDANPNTGVEIYFTPASGGGGWQTTQQGSWGEVGGTSLGTPAWAAIIAIADQGRAAGPGSLDGSTQTLPALYAAPSSDFNTVAPASSSFGGGGGFGYGYGYGAFWSSSLFGDSGLGASATTSSSSTGANTATGLGTPIGSALVPYFVSSTLTTPPPVTGSGGGTTPTPPPNHVGGGPGHHHRLTHSGSRTVKSGKTHAEAPARARSRHVKQGSVPKKLSTDRSLRD